MSDTAAPPTDEQIAAMRVEASWVREDAGPAHKFAADVLVLVNEVQRLRSALRLHTSTGVYVLVTMALDAALGEIRRQVGDMGHVLKEAAGAGHGAVHSMRLPLEGVLRMRDEAEQQRDAARGEVERLLQAERVAISDLEDRLERIVAELRVEAQLQEERGLSYPQGDARRMHMWISGRLCTVADRGGAP